MKIVPTLLLSVSVVLPFAVPGAGWAAGNAGTVPPPDFTRGDRVPESATHDWNLGPTGARGWIYSNKMETSEARQIFVTEVEKDSPADGILAPGDVILGTAGHPFAYDPRTELGRAISAAEAANGALPLMRWRAGKTDTVTLKLAVFGSYSPAAPFNCPKSSRIFEQGCEALALKMKANPKEGNHIIRALNALALLASGKPEYLPLVREQVVQAAKYSDPQRRELHSWFYGPVNLLLAEYTLATGDRAFVPDMQRITMEIVHGQSGVGSWGHRFTTPGEQRLGGYGMAAVLFNLMEDAKAAEFFSRMSVASHGAERDTGHTGNFFNILWAMPGVALSGPEASGAWMTEFGWYYDLARRWDGTFLHQGPPQEKPDSYRQWDATGAYLLAYAQPLRHIHLTGKQASLTSQADATTAKDLIEDGRGWSPRLKHATYAERSEDQLFAGLESWSPVVRERSALSLAERNGDPMPRLLKLLESDQFFARLSGLEMLARHRIAEGLPLCLEVMEIDRWGKQKRIEGCLNALQVYGGAAKSLLPRLAQLEKDLQANSEAKNLQSQIALIRATVKAISDDKEPPTLRPLASVR